eukprot:scpid99259/ scgid19156/ 
MFLAEHSISGICEYVGCHCAADIATKMHYNNNNKKKKKKILFSDQNLIYETSNLFRRPHKQLFLFGSLDALVIRCPTTLPQFVEFSLQVASATSTCLILATDNAPQIIRG